MVTPVCIHVVNASTRAVMLYPACVIRAVYPVMIQVIPTAKHVSMKHNVMLCL